MIPEDEIGKLHSTLNEKKVSMTPLAGSKPETGQATAINNTTQLQQIKKRSEAITNFVNGSSESSSSEQLNNKLDLSPGELQNLKKLKELAEKNFTTIYNNIPKLGDNTVQNFLNDIVKFQKKYFVQLSDLDCGSDTLDKEVEKFSAEYNKNFDLLIKDISQLNLSDDSKKLMNELQEFNKKVIDFFKSNVIILKKAKQITNREYRKVIMGIALICLGAAMIITSIALICSPIGAGMILGLGILGSFGVVAAAIGATCGGFGPLDAQVEGYRKFVGEKEWLPPKNALFHSIDKSKVHADQLKEIKKVTFKNLNICLSHTCEILTKIISEESKPKSPSGQ